MNERFEKIAVEVFFDESTNEPGQKMYTFGELKMQKFAELIVRECASQVVINESLNIFEHFDMEPSEYTEWLQARSRE